MFGPVAPHPRLPRRWWRASGARGVRRRRAGCAGRAGERAATVVALHRRMRALLRRGGTTRWTSWLPRRCRGPAGAPVVGDLGAVVLHLPQVLASPAAALLEDSRGPRSRWSPERRASRAADADVRGVAARCWASKSSRRRSIASAGRSSASATPTRRCGRRSAASSQAARDGVPLHRMAVLFPDRRALRAPVPRAPPRRRRALQRHRRPAAGRAHARALAAGPARRCGSAACAATTSWTCWRPRRCAAAEREWIPVARWEAISRAAGVVAGEDWANRLPALAQTRCAPRRTPCRATSDPPRRADRRLRGGADAADDLAAFVATWIVARLEDAAMRTTWADLVAWVRTTTNRYLGAAAAPRPLARGRARRRRPRRRRARPHRGPRPGRRARGPRACCARRWSWSSSDDLGRVGQLGRGVHVGRLVGRAGPRRRPRRSFWAARRGRCRRACARTRCCPTASARSPAVSCALRAERIARAAPRVLAALAAAPGRAVLSYPRGDLRRSLERPPRAGCSTPLRGAPEPDAGAQRCRRRPPGWPTAPRSRPASARTARPRPRGGARAAAERATASRAAGSSTTPVPWPTPCYRRAGASCAVGRAARSRVTTATSPAPRLRGCCRGRPRRVVADRAGGLRDLPARLPHRAPAAHRARRGPRGAARDHAAGARHGRPRGPRALAAQRCSRPPPAVPSHGPWDDLAASVLRAIAEARCDRGRGSRPRRPAGFWRRDRRRIMRDLETFLTADDAPARATRRHALSRRARVRGRAAWTSTTAASALPRLDRPARPGRRRTPPRHRLQDRQGRRLRGLATDAVPAGTRLQLPLYALAARQHFGDRARAVRPSTGSPPPAGGFRAIGYDLDDERLERFAPPSDPGRHHRERPLPRPPAEPGFRLLQRLPLLRPRRPRDRRPRGEPGRASAATRRWRRSSRSWSPRRHRDAAGRRPARRRIARGPRRHAVRRGRRRLRQDPRAGRPGRGTARTTACELQHIAAMTFTEKAAAELRDRVRRRLEDELAAPTATRSC